MKEEILWTVDSPEADTLENARRVAYSDIEWPAFGYEAARWEYLVHVSETMLSEVFGDRSSSHNEIRGVALSDCVICGEKVIGFIPGVRPEKFHGRFLRIDSAGEKITGESFSVSHSGGDWDITETFSIIEK